MNAQLVMGHVMHDRLRPRRNRFRYPVFYLRLNLAELSGYDSILFGVDRRRPVSVRTADYGPRDGSDLLLWARELLRSQGMEADGEIWLQTFPRIWGYVFNPVSFWFCHDRAGALVAVLAEVNNTFGETHFYLLAIDPATGEAHCGKTMHVSPFCKVEGTYQFRFRTVSRSHVARVDHSDAEGVLLRTALSGRAVRLSDRALAWALARHPLQSLGIVARIHWQAFRLWLKGVPFFGKPPAPQNNMTLQREVP